MHEYTGPDDYFNRNYVDEWVELASVKRPFRSDLFAAFAAELQGMSGLKVLDLGSGPGFLAEHLLSHCKIDAYHLFDFSSHMLELSRVRLNRFGGRAHFHEGSFLHAHWSESLADMFDAILSLQAIHEVRDASRIPQLYGEMRTLLARDGRLLIADEVNDEHKTENHLLTIAEHVEALQSAGLRECREILSIGGSSPVQCTTRLERSQTLLAVETAEAII